jgi:ribosome biogenesis protein ENP2
MDIKWHESVSTASKNLITSDSHIVRIWNPQTVSGIVFLTFLLFY